MNETAQRIAIAEACGLKVVDIPFIPNQVDREAYFTPEAAKALYRQYPRGKTVKVLPDYLNDLNAIHQAEKAVKDHGLYTYWISMIQESDHLNEHWNLATATSKQRAEAFLRTIGKWEEES